MGKVTVWRQLNLGDGTVADVAQVEQPHRAPSLEADVYVPMLQSLGLAVVVGSGVAAVACWGWQLSLWPCWPASIAICGGLAFLWRLSEIGQTLWHTESMAVLNTQPAEPARAPAAPGLLMLNAPAARADVADQVGQAERAQEVNDLVDFVRRCATIGTGESALGIKPSGRSKYLEAREILLELGAARWRDPGNKRLGWELAITPAAAVVLVKRHVAAKTATTYPTRPTLQLTGGRERQR